MSDYDENEDKNTSRLTGAQRNAAEEGQRLASVVTKEKHDNYGSGKQFDPVNNPRHYVEGRTIEPIDVMHDWDLNPSEAAALKYISRHKKKNGKEDLEKAIWYLNDVIKRAYPDA